MSPRVRTPRRKIKPAESHPTETTEYLLERLKTFVTSRQLSSSQATKTAAKHLNTTVGSTSRNPNTEQRKAFILNELFDSRDSVFDTQDFKVILSKERQPNQSQSKLPKQSHVALTWNGNGEKHTQNVGAFKEPAADFAPKKLSGASQIDTLLSSLK